MAFDGSISGYLSVDCTLKVLDVFILDACLVIILIWDIDILIMLIDYLD